MWKERSAECGKRGVWKMRSVENAECGKCDLQFDKKVTTRLNANRWNVIVNQFSFILMEYKLCRGVNRFLR